MIYMTIDAQFGFSHV